MRVREATLQDKTAWDTFVDTEGGNFFQYFDWKGIYEARGARFIPLLTESDESGLIGILPIVQGKKHLYSLLHSDLEGGGLLLKKGLSDAERHQVISAFLKHADTSYSKGCSRFELRENLPPGAEHNEEPTRVLVENGFRFRYDKLTHLPCTYIIKLEQPFEKNIWKGLWSSKFRQELNRVQKNGISVICDRELDYARDFLYMFTENFRRHGSVPPAENEMMLTMSTFRDKVKLFVALRDSQPIVALLCYYYASTCYLAEIGSYSQDTTDADKLCYKAAIEDACNAGYRFVDLSRTTTAGLASFKERFKGDRVPFRSYEKRYSIPGTLIELVPQLIRRTRH